MSTIQSTNDESSDNLAPSTYEVGQYFEEHNDPHVEGMVVVETGVISGYRGLRLAEKDTQTGHWRAYWAKEQYIVDEVNLGLVTPTKTLDADGLTDVQSNCTRSDARLTSNTR